MLYIFTVILSVLFFSPAFAHHTEHGEHLYGKCVEKGMMGSCIRTDHDIAPEEAYKMLTSGNKRIFLIDVRTPDEYILVGHPEMAYNIPFPVSDFGNPSLGRKEIQVTEDQFVKNAKKKFKEDDTIFLLCRSAWRSVGAANALAKAGFKNIYNIVDGFEGKSSLVEGHDNMITGPTGSKNINGWKNKLPYTYHIHPELMYKP
ncbi:MAG: sulfurtransferase [Nitrospirae bacterium]|nr:sulfurtransferase [Nitrospirota bacterium]